MSLIRLPKHYKETVISKPNAIATGLANAAQTATKFITDISGSGIWVTPDGAQPDEDGSVLPTTTGWHIADAIELFKSGASYFKVWVDSSIANVRVGLESGFNTIIQAGSFAIRYTSDRLFSVATDGLSVDISMGGSTEAEGTNYTDAKVKAVHRFLSSGCTVSDGVVYDPDGNDTSYTVTSLGFVKDGKGNSFSSASYSDITHMNGLFGLEPQLYPQSEVTGAPVSIDMGNVNVSAESGFMSIVGDTMVTGRAFSNSAKLLWSGTYLMSADHTATLSEHVSDQPNGILLVWSGFSGGAAQNYQWHFDYIPKAWVGHHSSDATRGITCIMAGAGFNPVATKYVYVNFGILTPDTITGHANNTASGTTNGITYSNASFVLREVWGV